MEILKKRVTVEALGPDNLIEETQSDNYGAFRIRGLIPGKTYSVRVKTTQKNSRLFRSEPSDFTLEVIQTDIEGIHFIVFRKSNKYDCLGTVDTPEEFISTLSVQLLNSENEVIKEQTLGPNNLFLFEGLDTSIQYSAKVQTQLSEKHYQYVLPMQRIEQPTDKHKIFISFNFTATQRKLEVEVENGSFGSLIFTAIVGICIYYYNKINDILKRVINLQLLFQKKKRN